MNDFKPGDEAFLQVGSISFRGVIEGRIEKLGGVIRYDFHVDGLEVHLYGVEAKHFTHVGG